MSVCGARWLASEAGMPGTVVMPSSSGGTSPVSVQVSPATSGCFTHERNELQSIHEQVKARKPSPEVVELVRTTLAGSEPGRNADQFFTK